MHITQHAVERYIERVEAVDPATARSRIAAAERAIDKAAAFGAGIVRMGNGARLVLQSDRVVTVYDRRHIVNFGVPLAELQRRRREARAA